MKLIIDISEEDYKRVKEKKLDAGLKSIITRANIFKAVETGVLFDQFKEIASNRITEAIQELNSKVSKQLTCYQCEYYDIPNITDAIKQIKEEAKDAANGKAEYTTMEEVFKEDCKPKGENK